MKNRKIMGFIVTCTLVATGCSSGEPQSAPESAASQAGGSVSTGHQAQSKAANDAAAPDGMYFQDYGTNSFVRASQDRFSTFAVDVDTGSYSVMRNYVTRGSLPPEDAVRVEEFVNYFPSSYAPPAKGTFAIYTDAIHSPFGERLRTGAGRHQGQGNFRNGTQTGQSYFCHRHFRLDESGKSA
ncbi:MAG: VWA domain-containing protein [Clostridia bacterium]